MCVTGHELIGAVSGCWSVLWAQHMDEYKRVCVSLCLCVCLYLAARIGSAVETREAPQCREWKEGSRFASVTLFLKDRPTRKCAFN